MKIINRKTKEIIDYTPSNMVKFLYNTFTGRIILKLFNNHLMSKLVGIYMNSFLSKSYLKKIVNKYHITLKKDYANYNAYFTRQEKVNFDHQPSHFISPCEAKLMVFKIDNHNKFTIKNSLYTTKEIINDDVINDYYDGYALIFRLAVDNYHRYLFIDDGTKEQDHYIKGILNTVQPIVYKKYKVFHENSRVWSIIHSRHFDDVIYCEVGAMNVGKIVNNDVYQFKKGDEKGHFEFGGSTIILFVKKNQVIIDEDIMTNSLNNMETMVDIGEKIGIKYNLKDTNKTH